MKQEFFEAIRAGDLGKIQEFLAQNSDLAGERDANGISAVLTALYYGQAEIAQKLISHHKALDIFEAAAAGQLDIVKTLTTDSKRISAHSPDGWTALHLASFFGHAEVAHFLIHAGSEIDARSTNSMKNTPLHAAMPHNQFETARLLLEHGADVNAQQGGAYTALHEAASNGSVEITKLLLGCGADRSLRSSDGKTAKDLAVEKGKANTAALL